MDTSFAFTWADEFPGRFAAITTKPLAFFVHFFDFSRSRNNFLALLGAEILEIKWKLEIEIVRITRILSSF
jgi:hypothetical protein